MDRALDYESKGWGFDSLQAHFGCLFNVRSSMLMLRGDVYKDVGIKSRSQRPSLIFLSNNGLDLPKGEKSSICVFLDSYFIFDFFLMVLKKKKTIIWWKGRIRLK